MTTQNENGETLTVCKSQDGHSEDVQVDVPADRVERALRIDTSQGTFGGQNALIPHAADQINNVGEQIGRALRW